MEPSLFTRLAVAEAELQAMKGLLAEVLDKLAEVEANQDELRQDRDEWRGWAQRLLAPRRLTGNALKEAGREIAQTS